MRPERLVASCLLSQPGVDSVDRSPALKRLTLGSTAYTSIRAALADRLGTLDAQKDIALSTDVDVGVQPD